MAEIPITGIPLHNEPGLRRYIEDRIPPGDFLLAALQNNLFEAVHRADPINAFFLADIVKWLWNHAPSTCWGSPEKVAAWLAERPKEDTHVQGT